jgi:hypothetical protein
VLLVSTVVVEVVVEETAEITVEQQVDLVEVVPVDLLLMLLQQEQMESNTPEVVAVVADFMKILQTTDLVVEVEPELLLLNIQLNN